MTALIVLEAVAILLLGLLVAGLLRSHADILRRLHALDGEGEGHRDAAPADFRVTDGVPAPAEGAIEAHDVSGVSPDGEAVAIAVTGTRHRTLLAFLSSGCQTCASFWRTFREQPDLPLPDGTRLLVVTKGPGEESESAIADVAPRAFPVVMSSEAWRDYGIPGSPYIVYADGPSGRVVGEGAATTWRQVSSLLGQAEGDALRGRRRAPGRADQDRADRVDAELTAAGITPGHPSLYPDAQEDEPHR